MINLFFLIPHKLRLARGTLFALLSRCDFHALKNTDILLLCHDADRSYNWNGASYSPLIDTFKENAERFGMSTLSIAMPLSRLNGSVTSSNALSLNRRYIISKIVEKVLGKFFNSGEIAFWAKVIRKTSPRYIVAIQPPPALSAAGKKTSVKVFDLQHGIIEPSVYYNDELTKKYGLAGLPDGVLVWDRPSEDALRSCLGLVRSIIIGNCWLERFVHPVGSDRLVKEALDRIKDICLNNSPVILVSLQWSKEPLGDTLIPDYVTKALFNLREQGWRVWIRFHPVQLTSLSSTTLRANWDAKTGILLDNVHVVDVSSFALAAILKQVTAHLTASSATSIEASLMGVPTLLWRNDESVREWFVQYIQHGKIEVLSGDFPEILEWAKKMLTRHTNVSREVAVERVSQTDISQIINKSDYGR